MYRFKPQLAQDTSNIMYISVPYNIKYVASTTPVCISCKNNRKTKTKSQIELEMAKNNKHHAPLTFQTYCNTIKMLLSKNKNKPQTLHVDNLCVTLGLKNLLNFYF